jgi:hypothetical protein
VVVNNGGGLILRQSQRGEGVQVQVQAQERRVRREQERTEQQTHEVLFKGRPPEFSGRVT